MARKPRISTSRSSRRPWAVGLVSVLVLSALAAFVLRPWESSRPELFPDFKMFPSARTFDAPGTVFRINPDGTRFDVIDLSSRIPTSGGDESIPEQMGHRKLSGEAISDFLSAKGSASASGSDSYDVFLSLTGVRREKIFDTDLDKVLATALGGIVLRRDSRYYVIRETIAARAISYRLTSSDAASAHIKVDQQKIANGNAKLERTSSGETRLVVSFEAANRIFYKPEEIKFESSGITGTLTVTRSPVTADLAWRGRMPGP